MSDNQPTDTSPSADLSFEARVEAIKNTPAEPAPEAGAPPPVVQASEADSASANAAEERRQRLAALQTQERAAVERKGRQAEQDKIRRDLEAAQKRAAEAEARAQKLVDLDGLDEAAFFRMAQQKGIAPQRLGEWIREAMANPERVAEAAALEAAKRHVDPTVKAMQERMEALERQLTQEREDRARAAADHEERQAFAGFVEFVGQSANVAPRSAAFLNTFGAGEFRSLVSSAVQQLPEGVGAQAVLDIIEENLSALAQIYGSANPSSPQSKPSPNRGAAKPNTVSNTLAQQRSAVVDEDDFASLPFEERVNRLKRTG